MNGSNQSVRIELKRPLQVYLRSTLVGIAFGQNRQSG